MRYKVKKNVTYQVSDLCSVKQNNILAEILPN